MILRREVPKKSEGKILEGVVAAITHFKDFKTPSHIPLTTATPPKRNYSLSYHSTILSHCQCPNYHLLTHQALKQIMPIQTTSIQT